MASAAGARSLRSAPSRAPRRAGSARIRGLLATSWTCWRAGRRPQPRPAPTGGQIAGARSSDQDALDRLAALARTLHSPTPTGSQMGRRGSLCRPPAGDVWLWSMADAMAPVLAEPTPATPLGESRCMQAPAETLRPRRCRARRASRADGRGCTALAASQRTRWTITAVPIALGDHVAADGGASPPPPAVASAASGSLAPRPAAPVRTLLPPALPPPHRLVWFGHVNDFEVVSEPGPGPWPAGLCSGVKHHAHGGRAATHDEGPTTALPEAKPALDPVLEPLTPDSARRRGLARGRHRQRGS